MFACPFIQKVEQSSRNILLLGMGGGYDVFSAIPLYFELQLRKKPDGTPMFGNLVLANLSFTPKVMSFPIGRKVSPICLEARFSDYIKAGKEDAFTEALGYPGNYFAEFHLSKWFHQVHKQDVPVYALSLYDLGVAQYTQALEALVKEYQIDTIVLVDAGVDSVLKNNEEGMGTYSEDTLSITAVKNVTSVQQKYLLCVGLGTEGGISEFDFLENWAGLIKLGGYLGSVGWHPDSYSVKQYKDALEKSVPTNSSINAQIVAGINGEHGHYCQDYLASRGLSAKDMYIHPFMSICWFFDLPKVIQYKLFMNELETATSHTNMEQKMAASRLQGGVTNSDGQYIGQRRYQSMFTGVRKN